MLTDALLDRTVIILSSYNGQTKKDPAFDLYKLGIKNAFIRFIEQCKLLPLTQQLEHITKEMKEKKEVSLLKWSMRVAKNELGL